jgi:hypothetical protein
MLYLSDFDEAFSTPMCPRKAPVCAAPTCFIGSYAPITPPGQTGPFFVNTKFLQADRYAETVGPVPVRVEDFKCTFKN